MDASEFVGRELRDFLGDARACKGRVFGAGDGSGWCNSLGHGRGSGKGDGSLCGYGWGYGRGAESGSGSRCFSGSGEGSNR